MPPAGGRRPGPRPRAPVQLLFAPNGPLGALERLARDHGDLAFFSFGPRREVLANHPDFVRQVLVTERRSFAKGQSLNEAKRVLGEGLLTSEGDFHLRQRRLMQPLFHQRAITGYAAAMVECVDQVMARWRPGETVDLHEELSRLTLSIVARTLFERDVEGEAAEIGQALTTAIEGVNRLVYPVIGPALDALPLPSTRRFHAARQRLDQTIYGLIEERRKRGLGDDLLSLLLAAVDDDDREGMSDSQVRDEAMTIMLAGHETTAVWLTWTLMLLAQHPDVEARVRSELAQVLDGRTPTVDDVAGFEYTSAVLNESLRLYPPVWILGRTALTDIELAGHRVPAGTVVLVSQWLMHRDARWHEQPETFAPERWGGAPPAEWTFFPFGGGVRQCIGEAFAWLEARLVLARILQCWDVRLVSPEPVAPLPRITLRPKGGLPATLAPRMP